MSSIGSKTIKLERGKRNTWPLMDDMFWNGFNQTKDHIVPDPSDAKESTWTVRGKQWKKLQCQNSNMLAKSAEQKMVGVNNVFEGKVSGLSSSDNKGDLSSQPLNVDTWVILHDEDLATNAYDPMCDNSSMGIDSQKQGVNGGCCKDLKSVNDDLILGYSKEDPLLASRDADVVTNSSHFLLSDISPTEGDLDLFEGDRRSETSNSILEYDWENMGNFEEVERLFRNSESTLSEAMDSSSDELIWHTASFVSSNHSHPRSMHQGIDSSNPEMTNMGRLQHTEPKVKMECVPCDSSSSLVFNQKDDSDVEHAPHNDQTSGYYIPLKKPSVSHLLASRGNTKNVSGTLFEKQKSTGGGVSEEAIRSQSPSQNEQTCTTYQYANKVSSNLVQTKDQIKFSDDVALNSQKVPYIHGGYGYPLHCLLTTPSSSPGPNGRQPQPYFAAYQLPEGTSNEHQAFKQHFDMISAPHIMTPQDKMENLRWCQQQDKLAIDHKQQNNSMDPSLLHKHPHKLQYQHADVKPQVADRISETLTGELDQQDNTSADCGSAFDNEDSSMEAAMLHQLQNSVMQLDIGTRLNIRDALYRLARNAVQRHNVDDIKHDSVTKEEDIEICLQDDRCAGISNFETETNAIDRMVAHLIFHRSPVASGERSFEVTEAPSDIMSSMNPETLTATSSSCLWDPSALNCSNCLGTNPLAIMQATIPVQVVTPIQDTCMGASNQCIINMQGSSSLTRSCNAASLHFHSQICDPLASADLHNTANVSLSKHQGASQNNNHASDAKCNLLTQNCAVLENGKGFDFHGMKKIEVSKPNDENQAEQDSSENMDIDICNISADVLAAEESSKVGVNKEHNSYMEIENMEHVVHPISPPARIMLVH